MLPMLVPEVVSVEGGESDGWNDEAIRRPELASCSVACGADYSLACEGGW